jgi:hypothetical protein
MKIVEGPLGSGGFFSKLRGSLVIQLIFIDSTKTCSSKINSLKVGAPQIVAFHRNLGRDAMLQRRHDIARQAVHTI